MENHEKDRVRQTMRRVQPRQLRPSTLPLTATATPSTAHSNPSGPSDLQTQKDPKGQKTLHHPQYLRYPPQNDRTPPRMTSLPSLL